MQNYSFLSVFAPHRFTIALLASLLLLSGCESDEKQSSKKDDDKKPAYERVVILKQRFSQLENSLDEMERDLEIQRKRIDSTRETAKSIKRSLLQGGLKGYSMDTVSSDPLVLQAIEKRQGKNREKALADEEKEESDDLFFNTLLIIVFLIFLIAIFAVAFKDRKPENYTASAKPAYPEPENGNDVAESEVDDDSNDLSGSSYTYGDLRRQDVNDGAPSLKDELMPPTEDTPRDEEPRQ